MLKKLTAILLICLLAFNWYGYRLLMNYMEDKASTHLQAKLDKNQYDHSNLIEIRVPLNMPYITDWDEFENYEGETELNGVHYKYVKRKVEKGELVLMCIPNQQKTSLQTAKHDFFKLVNDIDQPASKKASKDHTVKVSISDCITDNIATISMVNTETATAWCTYSFFIPSSFLTTPSQPPEC